MPPTVDSAYSVGAVIAGVDGQELARGYSRTCPAAKEPNKYLPL